MTQESGGADPHINPPSFIPAGNRRTRPSGQVPRSFAPARTSRQSGQAPSARPSVTGNDIEEPQLNANATASANVADNGRRTPPSFSPKTGRATRSTAPDAAAPRSIPPSAVRYLVESLRIDLINEELVARELGGFPLSAGQYSVRQVITTAPQGEVG